MSSMLVHPCCRPEFEGKEVHPNFVNEVRV